MLDRNYMRIPSDLFDYEKIIQIELLEDGDRTLNTWLYLVTKSKKLSGGYRGFIICKGFHLSDEVINNVIYPRLERDTVKHIERLESFGLAERKHDCVIIHYPWERDRSTSEYKAWRSAVLIRDEYKCRSCETRADLQVHHIVPWSKNRELRFDVENGKTLCAKCHLVEHGGCWRNG